MTILGVRKEVYREDKYQEVERKRGGRREKLKRKKEKENK